MILHVHQSVIHSCRKKETNEFNYKLKNEIRKWDNAGKCENGAKRKAKLRELAHMLSTKQSDKGGPN